MAKTKTTLIKLNMSDKFISFLSPGNYSKDFPRSADTQYKINIYDKDIFKNPYTGSNNTFEIRQSNWDFGKSMFFGSIKGTLSMNMVLFYTSHSELNEANERDFLNILKKDFEEIYNKETREEFSISQPENYQIKTISNLRWGYYEYLARQGRRLTYALIISDQHYLKVNFNFLSNSDSSKNNWEDNAQETVDSIVASFLIN